MSATRRVAENKRVIALAAATAATLVASTWAGCTSVEDPTNTTSSSSNSSSSSGSGAAGGETTTTTAEGGMGGVGGTYPCNPVTGEGCDRGASCDTDYNDLVFACYPGPNEVAACGACGTNLGWCASGHTCIYGACAKFCCDDADCGGATCDRAPLQRIGMGEVGICVASCTPPLPPPSQGSCVPGWQNTGGMGGAGGAGGSGGAGGNGGS